MRIGLRKEMGVLPISKGGKHAAWASVCLSVCQGGQPVLPCRPRPRANEGISKRRITHPSCMAGVVFNY